MPTLALLTVLGCGESQGEPFRDEGGDPEVTDELTPEEDWAATTEFLCAGAVPVFAVCPCDDVTIDWSRLTEDMFGEPVQPDSFRNLGLAGSTHASVQDFLADACDEDSITQASTAGYVDVPIEGETSVSLADMGFLGTPTGPLELGHTYILLWSDKIEPGLGTRMVALLSVVEDGADSIEMVWP